MTHYSFDLLYGKRKHKAIAWKMQLLELKKEFEECKRDLLHYHHVLEKREQEHQKIRTLKESVEKKLLQMHRISKTSNQAAEQLSEQITKESEEIDSLKKVIKDLDEQLDQLGEEKESLYEKLKQNLIDKIQENFPEASAEYQTLANHLQREHLHEKGLARQKILVEPLYATLKAASGVQVKRGFIDFLLGKNPTAHLARLIDTGATLAEKIYPDVTEEGIKNFLAKFLQQAKKPWHYALYQGKCTELFADFSLLISELDQKIARSKETILTDEQAIEKWIEKYCSGAPTYP
jgi:hypothetical protein